MCVVRPSVYHSVHLAARPSRAPNSKKQRAYKNRKWHERQTVC